MGLVGGWTIKGCIRPLVDSICRTGDIISGEAFLFLVFSLFQRGNLITQKEDFISRIRASETRYFYAMLYALLHFVLSLTYHIA